MATSSARAPAVVNFVARKFILNLPVVLRGLDPGQKPLHLNPALNPVLTNEAVLIDRLAKYKRNPLGTVNHLVRERHISEG